MQQPILQVLLTLCVFIVIWLLLAAAGSTLVDAEATLKWLDESWLKFLHPNIRTVLVSWGWQPLAALTFALLSYPFLEPVATSIRNKIVSPNYKLTDDAKEILKCISNENLLRRPEKIAEELHIDTARVINELNQLASYHLARERKRSSGTFWSITWAGRQYLQEIVRNK